MISPISSSIIYDAKEVATVNVAMASDGSFKMDIHITDTEGYYANEEAAFADIQELVGNVSKAAKAKRGTAQTNPD